ncbi:MAG TPA: hypothetical protein VIT92_03195 [Burkholderiaceae bacterium]
MSHILPILDGCTDTSDCARFEDGSEPRFIDWETRPGLFNAPMKAACIYIGHRSMHWGREIALYKDQTMHIAPGYTNLLQSIERGPDTVLFLSINGCELLTSMPDDDEAFDFHLPFRPDLPIIPGRPIIPFEVVWQQLWGMLGNMANILLSTRLTLGGTRIVNVIHPPVISDAQAKVDTRIMEKNYPGAEISPLSVRLKYYLMYVKMMDMICSQAQIANMMPPPAAIGPDGALLDEYAADVVHGNKLYGALVAKQMSDLIAAGGR